MTLDEFRADLEERNGAYALFYRLKAMSQSGIRPNDAEQLDFERVAAYLRSRGVTLEARPLDPAAA